MCTGRNDICSSVWRSDFVADETAIVESRGALSSGFSITDNCVCDDFAANVLRRKAMTYEEAIEAERTGTLVTYQGHSYRVKGHKKIGNGGHFVVIVQRHVLGVPFQPIEIGPQTLAFFTRAK